MQTHFHKWPNEEKNILITSNDRSFGCSFIYTDIIHNAILFIDTSIKLNHLIREPYLAIIASCALQLLEMLKFVCAEWWWGDIYTDWTEQSWEIYMSIRKPSDLSMTFPLPKFWTLVAISLFIFHSLKLLTFMSIKGKNMANTKHKKTQ